MSTGQPKPLGREDVHQAHLRTLRLGDIAGGDHLDGTHGACGQSAPDGATGPCWQIFRQLGRCGVVFSLLSLSGMRALWVVRPDPPHRGLRRPPEAGDHAQAQLHHGAKALRDTAKNHAWIHYAHISFKWKRPWKRDSGPLRAVRGAGDSPSSSTAARWRSACPLPGYPSPAARYHPACPSTRSSAPSPCPAAAAPTPRPPPPALRPPPPPQGTGDRRPAAALRPAAAGRSRRLCRPFSAGGSVEHTVLRGGDPQQPPPPPPPARPQPAPLPRGGEGRWRRGKRPPRPRRRHPPPPLPARWPYLPPLLMATAMAAAPPRPRGGAARAPARP